MDTNSSVEMIRSGDEVPSPGYDESDNDFDSMFISDCEIADSVMLAREKCPQCPSIYRDRSVDMGYTEHDDFEDDLLSADEYDMPLNDTHESTHKTLEEERKVTNRISSPPHDNTRGSPAVNIMEEGGSYGFKRKPLTMSCGPIPTTISLPNSAMC
jgi:hypothetical protein